MNEKDRVIEALKVGGIVSIRDCLLELEAKGQSIARTESGDPCWEPSPQVQEAIHKALHDGKTHYTAGAGILELREAIIGKVWRENFFFAGVDEVLVTAGAMHALYLASAAVGRRGDKVLVPTPTWTETVDHIVDAGKVPIYYEMKAGTDEPIDLAELRREMGNHGPVAMILNNPHNPTGIVLPLATVATIGNMCKEYGTTLISDEAYEHMIFQGYHRSPAQEHPDKTISIFSCSKTDAMPGLRVGYLVCPMPGVRAKMAALLRKSTNGVNSIGQWGAVVALNTHRDGYLETQVKALGERGRWLYRVLDGHPDFEPAAPQGAFYIWAKLPDGMDSWDATYQLVQAGIGSAPGDVFGPGGKGFIRFSFSCSKGNIERAVKLLGKFRLSV